VGGSGCGGLSNCCPGYYSNPPFGCSACVTNTFPSPSNCSGFTCSDATNTYCTPATGYFMSASSVGKPGPQTLYTCPAAGSLSVLNNCSDSITTCTATTFQCSLCAAGFGSTGSVTIASGAPTCAPCVAGSTWNDGTVSGACSPCSWCPAGSYLAPGATCNSASQSPCTACPLPLNSTATCIAMTCTSSSNSICTQCIPGYYAAPSGQCVACTAPCPAGTWQKLSCSQTADTACDVCTAIANCGTGNLTCTTSLATSSACSGCTSGYYYLPGASGSANTCPSCASQITGCTTATCHPDGSTVKCTRCGSGYLLSGGNCLVRPPAPPPPCKPGQCV